MSVALSSWKEIAAYLGKGVRTVQRWERQFGLPVRRPNAKSHIIFAFPQELDSWVKRHQRTHDGVVDALQTSKKERLKQHELLGKLRSSYTRLEANERLLGSYVNQLLEGFRANSLNSTPKPSQPSRANGKFQKTQSRGAA